MSLAAYENEWRACRDSGDKVGLLRLARKIAHSFMDRFFQDDTYQADCIELLCEMGTAFDDPVLNQIASSALFEIIIEQLCDEFEDRQLEIYNRVMAQIVTFCRRHTRGIELDRQLEEFDLDSCEQLIGRAARIQEQTSNWDKCRTPKRIFILSRITIGADVAVVSVLLQRIQKLFPQAELVIIGESKLEQVFGDNPRVTIKGIDYARRGGILERFDSWFAARKILETEIDPKPDEDYLIIDPDSRITQLGILPLAAENHYLFLNTRKNSADGKHRSMAEIVNHWVDTTFGASDFCYPKIWLSDNVMRTGRELTDQLRQWGYERITAINMGVGGNSRKRLGIDFEKKLLLKLLQDPKTVILFDQGFGAKEKLTCSELLRAVEAQGHATAELEFGAWSGVAENIRIYAVQCSVAEMASLIGAADDYIGYDSAGQHIAAALKVPGVTIFAGTNNPRFIRRWSGSGDTQTRMVHVNTLSDAKGLDHVEIIERILHQRSAQAENPVSKIFHKNIVMVENASTVTQKRITLK